MSGTSTAYSTKLDANELAKRVEQIKVIASDVDGTLLSSKGTLPEYTKQQVLKAIEATRSPTLQLEQFIIATGKSRKGALDSLGPEIKELLQNVPGVFIQGLYCTDGNGKVVFEQKLSKSAVIAVADFAKEHEITLICYDGDNLYTTSSLGRDNEHVQELHTKFGEPLAEYMKNIADYEPGFHRCLLIHRSTDYMNKTVRPLLQKLSNENDGTDVTQSVDNMLELLPKNCSKGRGVEMLLKDRYGDTTSSVLMAIGDAENDVTMLKIAAISVAVGNAKDIAKNAANIVLEATNDNGAAGVAIAEFGLGCNK